MLKTLRIIGALLLVGIVAAGLTYFADKHGYRLVPLNERHDPATIDYWVRATQRDVDYLARNHQSITSPQPEWRRQAVTMAMCIPVEHLDVSGLLKAYRQHDPDIASHSLWMLMITIPLCPKRQPYPAVLQPLELQALDHLIENGADINLRVEADDGTVSHILTQAVKHRDIGPALAEWALQAGADPDAYINDETHELNGTALFILDSHDRFYFQSPAEHARLIEILSRHGADHDRRSKYGETALMNYLYTGGLSRMIVDAFIREGSAVNARVGGTETPDALRLPKGSTSLHSLVHAHAGGMRNYSHYTADNGDYHDSVSQQVMVTRMQRVLDALLQAGADPTLTDANGDTALDIAQRSQGFMAKAMSDYLLQVSEP